ncbi:MAG: cell division FtsA domain-containing protein [Patescibacteria group bacterium]
MGEFVKGEKNPRIIGAGEGETKGVRHGYVVNSASLVNSLRNTLNTAENSSGIKIKRAFIALGGTTLRGEISGGMCVISKADGEVTSLDVGKVLQDCEDNLNLNNKKVVQVSPVYFRLDGKEVLGRLEGMYGTKLEAKAIFVTYSMQHLEDLLEAVAEAGVKAIDIIASPVAISHLVLSEKQKIVGVALVAIGDQTTSLSVFENGLLISIKTFSIGSSDITNDIALGLKIPLEQAERLKKGEIEETHQHKKLKEIVEARLSDIFELIENHLKKIKRNELLPAGIVFVGGGANIKGLEELSKSVLKLPSGIGTTELFSNSKTKLRDPSWFTALGLIMYGKDDNSYSDNSLINLFKDIKNIVKSSVKQLIP